jgi:hypothetical protein
VALFLALGACTPPARPAASPSTVSLRLRGTPPDATVVIDERTVGPLDFVAAHGVAMPPGSHRITVQARGYFSWDREVRAAAGAAPIRLDVALVPVPE